MLKNVSPDPYVIEYLHQSDVIGKQQILILKMFIFSCSITPFRHGWSDQCFGMGGLKGPPRYMAIINFFKHLSLFGCQGFDSKSIALCMKNCNSQNCLKIGVFGEYPFIVFAKGGGAEKPPPP